jgi:hypothetical protein
LKDQDTAHYKWNSAPQFLHTQYVLMANTGETEMVLLLRYSYGSDHRVRFQPPLKTRALVQNRNAGVGRVMALTTRIQD